MEKKLQDSGNRTHFAGGAMKDIDETKGRCDLVYNKAWGEIINNNVYQFMEDFVRTGKRNDITILIAKFITTYYPNEESAYLDVAKHYAAGAAKYEPRNMEKGYPFHCLVDSALRHYTKFKRGDTDEPHGAAYLWNLLTLLYMIDNRPECNDLPYANKEEEK